MNIGRGHSHLQGSQVMPDARPLFFFHGIPDYENLFPLAQRLAERGLPVKCYGATAPLRREPRLRRLIAESSVDIRLRPNKVLKRFSGWWIRPGDVPVVLADPALDASATIRRSAYLRKRGINTIFVQHGVIQIWVNFPNPDTELRHFHSALLLLNGPPAAATSLAPETRGRARQVGFLKAPIFAPRTASAAFRRLQSEYARTVLICHSLRWGARYSGSEIEAFYSFVQSLAGQRPDHLFILRGHRGKARAIHNQKDTELLKSSPNIVLSNAHSGLLKGLGMQDVLDLADLTISTASTAILDSLYRGKMAAVYRNEHQVYESLPNVTCPEDALRFLDAPPLEAGAALKRRFGEIDANLDRAASMIERYLAS